MVESILCQTCGTRVLGTHDSCMCTDGEKSTGGWRVMCKVKPQTNDEKISVIVWAITSPMWMDSLTDEQFERLRKAVERFEYLRGRSRRERSLNDDTD